MLALILAAATALPPAPPPPPPPELWHGARAGMTPAQVAALFPKGHGPLPPPIKTAFPSPNLVEGPAGAGWVVEETVYGYPAVATYYFAAGRLLSVLVDVQNLQLNHTRDNVEVARAVEAGLTDYYGAPKVCADTGKGGLARLDCRWVVRNLQVGLSYVDYGGLNPSLTVATRPTPPKKRAAPIIFSRRGVH
jgi:hypothetical protein